MSCFIAKYFLNLDFQKQWKKVTKSKYILPHSRHHGKVGDGMCQVLYSEQTTEVVQRSVFYAHSADQHRIFLTPK